MKKSWGQFFRRVATACMVTVAGSGAWHSAVCYAAAAFDSASDPAYADGWQGITHAGTAGGGAQLTTGDNGGFGFTAWNFDSAYTSPGGVNYGNYAGGSWTTNSTHPENDLGASWTLAHTLAPEFGFPRAGRGFAPLQIGQSIKVIFDNPTERRFFKGYFIRLNGGTGGVNGNTGTNGQPSTLGGTPVTKMLLQRFEYANDGEWGVVDADDDGLPPDDNYTPTGRFDTDTADLGALFQVTRTGTDTYDVLLDPFGPAPSFTLSETFANPGVPVDWIEFTMFNDIESSPTDATDFYIRSIEITDAPGGDDADFDGDGDVDGADFLSWQRGLGVTSGATKSQGDANSDGDVDAADLTAWRAQFATPSAPVAGAVPEPGGCVIACAAAAAGLAWRRRM